MMFAQHGIEVGWIEVGSIDQFVRHPTPLTQNCAVALITCIDSHRNPADLSKVSDQLNLLGVTWRPHRGAILIQIEHLPLVAKSMMNGFDEVWFLTEEPNTDIRPPFSLTSETPLPNRPSLNDDLLKELANWMHANQSILGMGDGIGLNFITTDCDIATKIEKIMVLA